MITSRDRIFGYDIHDSQDDDRMMELRKAAVANLMRIRAGEYRKEPKPKKKTELQEALAWEIELGDVVLEMRQLMKIELRYAKREERLTPEERAHWEEVDARLDTLREELKDYGKDEQTRFVRLWNKAQKKGSAEGPQHRRKKRSRRG